MSELKKEPGKNEKITSQDYEELIDQYQFSSQELKPGSMVKGKIIRVTPTPVSYTHLTLPTKRIV